MHRRSIRLIAVTMAVWLPSADAAVATSALPELTKRSYLDLLEAAPAFSFPAAEFDAARKELAREREAEKARLQAEEKKLDERLADLRSQLESLNKEASTDTPKMAERRTAVHCEILSLEKQRREKRVEREKGLPVAFENKLAKLDLVQQWPAKKKEIDKIIAEGRARQRRYGDAEDVGVRKISSDQEKDVKLGQDAVRELKVYGLMPPELESKEVTAYVRDLAQKIASNSDVTVPVKATVLNSQEINAFALPGGFLYLNTGLLDRAETESELAGVIAHELAHVSARHGSKMMKRATIASIVMQAAQVAAVLLTGGIGLGAYYALQYGFVGLGLVIDLSLLGVNRVYEAEADQLGAQYAWHAGYDPRGFITFFDKMASEKGYVKSASFFRTHPPFFERILSTVSEIEYLPKNRDLAIDSTAFQQFKKDLKEAKKRETIRKEGQPSLRGREPQCEEPPRTPASGQSLLTPAYGAVSAIACAVCPFEE
jgi:Zn-dependent protease with chaperone function